MTYDSTITEPEPIEIDMQIDRAVPEETNRQLRSLAVSEDIIRRVQEHLAFAFKRENVEPLPGVTPVSDIEWEALTPNDFEIVMIEAIRTPLAGHALRYVPEAHRHNLSPAFFVQHIRQGLPGWIAKFATPDVQENTDVQAAVAEWEAKIQDRLHELLTKNPKGSGQ